MTGPRLEGRTILVTGASRGIGEVTAERLAAAGARVGLLARNAGRIAALAERIEKSGGTAYAAEGDVASRASVADAYTRIRAALGPADGVLNNAGLIAPIGRLHETDPAEWLQNVSVNLVGAYNVLHSVLPDLLASRRGVVVNMSSRAAARPTEGWSAYCAGKAGLMMLTCILDVEYGPEGLSAYGLRPGVVDTEMQVKIRASGINEISRIPRANLARPEIAAAASVWFFAHMPADLRGKDVDIRDEEIRQRMEGNWMDRQP